jgi:hypothetical protein
MRRAPLRRATFAALALGCGASVAARAQTTAYVDVGSGAARFDNIPGSTVVTLSPSLQVLRPRARFAAGGTYSVFDHGGWSGQGLAGGSLFTPAWRALRGEVSARAEASARASGLGTGQALGVARAHLLDARRGTWLGGTVGRAWRGSANEAVLRGDAGAWARLGPGRIALSLTRAIVHDSVLRAGGLLDTLTPPPDTLWRRTTAGYTEAASAVEWAAGPVELAGSVARRFGRRDYQATSWSLSGTVWVSPRIGVIAGAGRYPPDLAQAHPGGRYLTLAMRLALSAPARARARAAAAPTGTGSRLEVVRADDGSALRLSAPGARSVEIAGDFTDWQPVSLIANADGTWSLALPLSPGTYRINVRLDGGPWTVPAGLAVERDEFSGIVGLLLVGG